MFFLFLSPEVGTPLLPTFLNRICPFRNLADCSDYLHNALLKLRLTSKTITRAQKSFGRETSRFLFPYPFLCKLKVLICSLPDPLLSPVQLRSYVSSFPKSYSKCQKAPNCLYFFVPGRSLFSLPAFSALRPVRPPARQRQSDPTQTQHSSSQIPDKKRELAFSAPLSFCYLRATITTQQGTLVLEIPVAGAFAPTRRRGDSLAHSKALFSFDPPPSSTLGRERLGFFSRPFRTTKGAPTERISVEMGRGGGGGISLPRGPRLI